MTRFYVLTSVVNGFVWLQVRNETLMGDFRDLVRPKLLLKTRKILTIVNI